MFGRAKPLRPVSSVVILSSGKVRRLLILTPASLVEQWQHRLNTLFDIRMSIYRPEDTMPKADFWNIHHQVVVSLPLCAPIAYGRHERLLDAPRRHMLRLFMKSTT